jgi:hypothetical protein
VEQKFRSAPNPQLYSLENPPKPKRILKPHIQGEDILGDYDVY